MVAARETNPWLISGSLHAAAVVGALVLFLARANLLSHDVEITLVDAPKASPQAVEISKPKPKPQVAPRQIFGASRKANTSEEGLDIKQGNTVAKAPDNDKLLPSDADSIPIPTEDYLVTAMPQLEREIVIPYP